MIRDAVVTNLADEDVGRINGVGEICHDLAMEVEQRDGDVNGLFGHGHVIACGKGLADLGRLLGRQPLLEKRREGVYKQRLARSVVFHLNLAVALEGDVGEAALATSPLRGDIHLLQINLLGVMVARKHIVEAQGASIKKLVKLLSRSRESHQSDDNGKEE